MINGLFNYGALPSLERLVNFTDQRQRALADNIANLSTPNYKPYDLPVDEFQKRLGRAIDHRRSSDTPLRGSLDNGGPPSVHGSTGHGSNSTASIDPEPNNRNILFHDRNNRDLERLMQDVAENALTHRVGVSFLKNEMDLMETAIRGRV